MLILIGVLVYVCSSRVDSVLHLVSPDLLTSSEIKDPGSRISSSFSLIMQANSNTVTHIGPIYTYSTHCAFPGVFILANQAVKIA